MATRWRLNVVALCTLLATSSAHADIYRWDTGEVIPGTEGIEPGPGVQLDDMSLQYADLREVDLTGANFELSDLSNARLSSSTLTDADLTGATVTGAWLDGTTSNGLTAERLYSTASYQNKNLRGIRFSEDDLTGWDLSGQDLTHALFGFCELGCLGSDLADANLAGANLANAVLGSSTLTNANLTGAVVTGVVLSSQNPEGITKEQLYSTASYQQKNLQRTAFADMDLTGWDFGGQDLTGAFFGSMTGSNLTDANFSGSNLTNASLSRTTLTNADFVGAIVSGADLADVTQHGFTKEQLYSTASYQQKNLRGVRLAVNELTGWDFSGQDIQRATFGADFSKEQLYSTASYQEKNLRGIQFIWTDLTGWDLSEQDLIDAHLRRSTLTNANLTGANLKNASLESAVDLPLAMFDSNTVYNQWTVFPVDFNPVQAGLKRASSPAGDFDANDALEVTDVDLLARVARIKGSFDPMFDLSRDLHIDEQDHHIWIKDLKHTWFGDASLDGEFNSGDLVQVFAAGKYEKGWLDEWGDLYGDEASWSQGDWNGDGIFDSSDMVTAFVDGGYEKGPRTDAVAVPEPAGVVLALAAACLIFVCCRVRQRTPLLLLSLTVLLGTSTVAHADIYRWDTGEVIPGTEGIEPGPGVQLDHLDLGWADFSNMNLTRANFVESNLADSRFAGSNLTGILFGWPLTNVDLTGAIVNGATITVPDSGITKEQLFSTASYQAKTLQGIQFKGPLGGWDFSGQDLTNAEFSLAALTDADFTDAIITGVFLNAFAGARLSKEQLYSTKSYQDGNLRGLRYIAGDLRDMDLSNMYLVNALLDGVHFDNTNLTGANLANANLGISTLDNANLSGANLVNTNLADVRLRSVDFDSETVYSEDTVFPEGFDPAASGLTLVDPIDGDYDASGHLDVADIDIVAAVERGDDWLNQMNWVSGLVEEDHRSWVKDVRYTWYGDANLDSEFDSGDMVQVFAAGRYETDPVWNYSGALMNPATWSEGDWNGDGLFNSSDMVTAFTDGGYEQGPRTDAMAVPEPGGWLLLLAGLSLCMVARRSRCPI